VTEELQRINGISTGECKEWNRGRLWLADEQMNENNVWDAGFIYQSIDVPSRRIPMRDP
jgi:hypothetical protein